MAKQRSSRQNPDVRDFILRNVEEHPGSIVTVAAKLFGLSRTTAHRYVVRLQDEGLLYGHGNTKARQYSLRTTHENTFKLELFYGLPEHHIWTFRALPELEGLPNNILDLCQYGFTEILNNAIDHSVSTDCLIGITRNYANISILIRDYGVGIFEKIRSDFKLQDTRTALFELSKGRLTSDKKRHSGEGIYFTSRMFDVFAIHSGELFYRRDRQEDDEWLIQTRRREDRNRRGTSVFMKVATDASWTTKEVFNKHTGDNIGFRRTHVPLSLGLYENDALVSRSQAKRILARFENFSEVLLDFHGVDFVGQPFADEIFRVFANEHPDTRVIAVRAASGVQRVIDYVTSGESAIQTEMSF